MKQVLQNVKTGKLSVAKVPKPVVRKGTVLVRNERSLISAGTEGAVVDFANKNLLGKAKERPDLVRQAIEKLRRDSVFSTVQSIKGRLETDLPLGYNCSGEVIGVGEEVTEFRIGDRVACGGA